MKEGEFLLLSDKGGAFGHNTLTATPSGAGVTIEIVDTPLVYGIGHRCWIKLDKHQARELSQELLEWANARRKR